MTFLPVVQRELRVAARRRRHYIVRASVAAGGLLVLSYFLAIEDFSPASLNGKSLFQTLVFLLDFFAVSAGFMATADAISSEKREDTLGLLFLTPLHGVDVVLGKIAATSISTLYAVVAAVPVLALPILLGGVSAQQVTASALATFNLLFLALTVGIASSSVTRLEKNAVGLAGSLLLTLFTAPLLAAFWHYSWAEYSPGYAAVLGVEKPFWGSYWQSMITTQVEAWFFLAFACWRTPKSWRQNSRTFSEQLRDAWDRVRMGSPEYRSGRRGLLEADPICWLATRDRVEQTQFWVVLAVVMLIWIIGLVKVGKNWIYTAAPSAVVLHLVLKVWCVNAAIRPWNEGRHTGVFALLMMTPLGGQPLIAGHFRAMQKIALPLAAVLPLDLLLFTLLSETIQTSQMGKAILVGVVMVVVLLADLYALIWMGMWQGLRRSGNQRASLVALAAVHVPRWAFVLLFVPLMRWPDRQWEVVLALWVTIALFVDGYLIVHSQARLQARLRPILCDDPDPAPAETDPVLLSGNH